MGAPIYVEVPIRAPLAELWRHTQSPELHQRWDLRFTRIAYLPRPDPVSPQRFLYAERRGCIVDYLGTHQHLAVDIDLSADERGGLCLRSGEQRFYEARSRFASRCSSPAWRTFASGSTMPRAGSGSR